MTKREAQLLLKTATALAKGAGISKAEAVLLIVEHLSRTGKE